jgi:hypothetical protein
MGRDVNGPCIENSSCGHRLAADLIVHYESKSRMSCKMNSFHFTIDRESCVAFGLISCTVSNKYPICICLYPPSATKFHLYFQTSPSALTSQSLSRPRDRILLLGRTLPEGGTFRSSNPSEPSPGLTRIAGGLLSAIEAILTGRTITALLAMSTCIAHHPMRPFG